MPGEPQDEEDADIIVERPQPSISAHKKIFQTVDDFIGIGHYLGRYQKLKKELEATIIPYKDVYMYDDMENITHSKILSFCNMSSAIHAACFSQPELLSL
jgi:hypothetical protein